MLSQELKMRLQPERSQIIQEKGFNSLDYIKKLISDCREIINAEEPGVTEVLEKLGINVVVLGESQD